MVAGTALTSEKFKGRGSCRPLVHGRSKSLPLVAKSVCVEPRVRCILGTKGVAEGASRASIRRSSLGSP